MFHGWDTTYLTVLDTFWYPPFPRRNHFYFFQIPKKSELRTHLKSDFEGYPQKSFTKNTSVLKLDFLKKGGVGTLRILL